MAENDIAGRNVKIDFGLTPMEGIKDSDPVNNPSHYKSLGAECIMCKHPIECIDVTQHMNFNLGNAIKYVWRSEHKGKRTQDLQKAIFYLNKEINRLESTIGMRKDGPF